MWKIKKIMNQVYGYSEATIVLTMFILVSTPFEFITRVIPKVPFSCYIIGR